MVVGRWLRIILEQDQFVILRMGTVECNFMAGLREIGFAREHSHVGNMVRGLLWSALW